MFQYLRSFSATSSAGAPPAAPLGKDKKAIIVPGDGYCLLPWRSYKRFLSYPIGWRPDSVHQQAQAIVLALPDEASREDDVPYRS